MTENVQKVYTESDVLEIVKTVYKLTQVPVLSTLYEISRTAVLPTSEKDNEDHVRIQRCLQTIRTSFANYQELPESLRIKIEDAGIIDSTRLEGLVI